MITEKEFIKNCNAPGVCGEKFPWKICQFYEKCLPLRMKFNKELPEKEFNASNYKSVLYKEFISIWRKEKLEKLLK